MRQRQFRGCSSFIYIAVPSRQLPFFKMYVDAKLLLLGFSLALVLSSLSLIIDVTYAEFEAPAATKLLFLASVVELALLIGFTSSQPSRGDTDKGYSKLGGHNHSPRKRYSPPDTPYSPKGVGHGGGAGRDQVSSPSKPPHLSSPTKGITAVCLDVTGFTDTQPHGKPFAAAPGGHKQLADGLAAKGSTILNSRSSGGSGCSAPRTCTAGTNPLPLLLASAVLLAVAGNVNIYLLNLVSCYAWNQLALLQIVAMAIIYNLVSSSKSSSSSKLRATFNTTGRTALAVLLLTVCVGQGVFGGGRAIPIPEDEEASMLPAGARAAPAVVLPRHVFAAALVAAFASALAALLLDLAQQAAPKHVRESPQVYCIWRCVLYVLCNALWFLLKESDGLDGFWDDLMAPHWHAILLLGVAGVLTSILTCWPATDAILARGYAFQGAVVLSAWGSNLVLDVSQGTLFACSSLLGGSALLLLHNSMQRRGVRGLRGKGPADDSHANDPLGAALHGALKSNRISPQTVHNILSHLWAVTTSVLLVVTVVVQVQHTISDHMSFSFSNPASAHAMANFGITPQLLSATSDAPFPATVLYASTRLPASLQANSSSAQQAAAGSTHGPTAVSTVGNTTTALLGAPSAAGAGPAAVTTITTATAAAWALCPAWNCSVDATCTSHNTSCCAHLRLQTMAFWDAFMHSHGLGDQHMVLYDTLMDALLTATTSPAADVLHVGVSAQALVVLERPCLKEKLWQHGYALFLQGDTWRLCAHRHHPLAVFQQHMHPFRHQTPIVGNNMQLHAMWKLHRHVKQPQHNSNATNSSSAPVAQQQQQEPPASTPPGRMSSLWGASFQQAASRWHLCSNEVVTTGPGHTVSLDGLHLPRPIDAQHHLAELSQQQLAASGKGVVTCTKLISELVAHMPA